MPLPEADQHLENLYRLVFRLGDEKTRCEVARIAYLAGEFRLQQIKQQRTAKAIELRTAARKALREASHGLETAVTHSQAQDCLSPGTEPGNSQEGNRT